MLDRGAQVPHFDATTLEGTAVRYATIWQRQHLVLLVLPDGPDEPGARYADQLVAALREFDAGDVACVVTRHEIGGLTPPAVLVADRWGEVAWVDAQPDLARLAAPAEVLEWLRHVQQRCPECEGEAR
ncbi:MAG TPA: hypothetical protein VD833_02310 [Vicinamibacterales bacterium]|nr:hypothetical protein [Vicinamibacterales bacterium]